MMKDIDSIIARILAKEASMEEIITFGEWVNESEENRKAADILAEFWQCRAEQDDMYAQTSFCRNKDCIFGNEDSHQASGSKRSIGRLFLSIAASFLVLLVGYWYVNYNAHSETYVLVAQDNVETFMLPDSSKVVLNKNSKLTYTDQFLTKNRAVTLEGEGYFEVVENAGRKFTVDVGGSQIEVLGTKFNIDARNVAERIVTTLIEGSVMFRNGKHEELMSPNHQLTYYTKTGVLDYVAADAYVSIEWKDNVFRCKSMRIDDLMQELGEYYGVDIEVDSRYDTIVVSGAFSRDMPLERVLGIIQNSTYFRWKIDNGKVNIY